MAGLAFAGATFATAHARAEGDCRALAQASRVDLAALASETRRVTLRTGETLHFRFQAEPGPLGILALVEGPGAPQMLLVGSAGTEASFTADRSGAFAFQFTREGTVGARFAVTCTPAGPADQGHTSAHAKGARPADLPIDDDTAFTHVLEIGETEAALMRAVTPGELPPITAPPGAGASVASPNAAAAGQMNMHWLDQRYRAGPDGPQIDPNASGLEIGLNYKLQSSLVIGALAQVNPSPELPLGGQRSLLDQGWMAGPVATLKLAPGLVLDARAAWGEGESGPEEAAAAQRRLVVARLSNQQVFGAWRFTPSVNFNYLAENPHGVEAGAGTAPHATGAGRVDVGPELAYRVDLPSKSFIEPRAVVGGFWDFDDLAKAAPGAAQHQEMRLKAEGGVTFGVIGGPKLEALGGVEAGDRETPDSWTGRVQLSVPLK